MGQGDTAPGFTLIELSIVLVVIGLIVGGILVGQDLIKTAETRAPIFQIKKYNQAANTFFAKYNALPGDMALSQAAGMRAPTPQSRLSLLYWNHCFT